MNWVNPADALRAKIAGRLDCRYCEHILQRARPWCTKRTTDPAPNKPFSESVCKEFQDHQSNRFIELTTGVDE